jgi:hypothetical protein
MPLLVDVARHSRHGIAWKGQVRPGQVRFGSVRSGSLGWV